eukprot:3007548-Heterocapsa_arctica.AAC.1
MDNSRAASNFNAFLPDDPRNEVEGRTGAAYDAVIVYNTDLLLKDKPMTISHNGVIACEDVIDHTYIDYIYVRTSARG